jgi:hypothetical protein
MEEAISVPAIADMRKLLGEDDVHEKHDSSDDQAADLFDLGRAATEDVQCDKVRFFSYGYRSAEKSEDDEKIASQFLGPRRRNLQYEAGNYLQKHDEADGSEKDGTEAFDTIGG